MLADLLLIRMLQEDKKPILKISNYATEVVKIGDGYEDAVPASMPQRLRKVRLNFTMPCDSKISLKPTSTMVEFIALINQRDPQGKKLLGVIGCTYCIMNARFTMSKYPACDMQANLMTVHYLTTDMTLSIPAVIYVQHNSYREYLLENVRKKLHSEGGISFSHDLIMKFVTEKTALGMEEIDA